MIDFLFLLSIDLKLLGSVRDANARGWGKFLPLNQYSHPHFSSSNVTICVN